MAKKETKRTPIGKVRDAARALEALGKSPFGSADLAELLGIQDYAAQKALLSGGPIQEMCKSGELERVSRGRYRWRGKLPGPASAEERLWFTLRKLRRGRVEDLAELAEISPGYCLERLRAWFLLGKLDIAPDGALVLLQDSVEMPKDEARTEKCRKWRERQQEALKALLEAGIAVERARLAVSQMEEG